MRAGARVLRKHTATRALLEQLLLVELSLAVGVELDQTFEIILDRLL